MPQAVEISQPVVAGGKVVATQSMFFGKTGLDGKPYAPYGPLAAVLAAFGACRERKGWRG